MRLRRNLPAARVHTIPNTRKRNYRYVYVESRHYFSKREMVNIFIGLLLSDSGVWSVETSLAIHVSVGCIS